MKILMRGLPYTTAMVEMTAAELEVMVSVFCRVKMVEDQYIKSEYRTVLRKVDPPRTEFTVITGKVLTEEEAKALEGEEVEVS